MVEYKLCINVLFMVFQCSDKLGLSLELGSFVAGVMISTTDFAQHTLDQVMLPDQIFDLCNTCSNSNVLDHA